MRSAVGQKVNISKNRMFVGGKVTPVGEGQRRVGVSAMRRLEFFKSQKQRYLVFYSGRQQLRLAFIRKLRYRCLCLWISKVPFAFIRLGLRNKVDRWSIPKKNQYMRCCRNSLWCGNVFNSRWGYKRERDKKFVGGRFGSRVGLGSWLGVRSKLLYKNKPLRLLGESKILRFVGGGGLVPYGSDFNANPLFKNYMRFSRCFGEVGGRSDKVNGWLRLVLYRRLRFQMYKSSLLEQFYTQLYVGGECLSSVLNICGIRAGGFLNWFRFYLSKRWWKPGLFQ